MLRKISPSPIIKADTAAFKRWPDPEKKYGVALDGFSVSSGKWKRRFGMDFPTEASDIFIHLVLAKKWQEPAFAAGNLKDPWEHLLIGARGLLTRDQFSISRWTEEHARDWTCENFCITWGCASSCKSNDYGCFSVLDWLVDPSDTLTFLASTSTKMLRLRTWESVVRYFKTLKQSPRFEIPGVLSKTRMAILNDTDTDGAVSSDKAGIHGVAVEEGTVDEARAKLQGGHLPYVRLILDELSQMKPAAMEARFNLMSGVRNFKLFGLCNPDSLFDLACQYSEPVGKFGSVDADCIYWTTDYGAVRHHNGFHSPAVLEPKGAERYPHVQKQSDQDTIIKAARGNLDHKQVHTMIRGFPPPAGATRTILSERELTTFNMLDPVVWETPPVRVAALDPAFTAEGDECVIITGGLGYSKEGIMTIGYDPEPIYLTLEASSGTPILDQIVRQTVDIMQARGIRPENMAVDDSGTQSVADALVMRLGAQVFRANFSWRPTELPVSSVNATPADDVYSNRITEYYFGLAEFGRSNQIRGLPREAAIQICRRDIDEKKRPFRIVTKREAKKVLGRSPDEGDAAVLLAGLCRERFGLVAGTTKLQPGGNTQVASMCADPGWLAKLRAAAGGTASKLRSPTYARA